MYVITCVCGFYTEMLYRFQDVLEIADKSIVPMHTCISVTMYNIVHLQ